MAQKRKSNKKNTENKTVKKEGNRQIKSVVWFAVAIFLLCVVFIKGENLWLWLHNLVLVFLVFWPTRCPFS
jgi:hypothetical protein